MNEMPALRALIGEPAASPPAVDWDRVQAGLRFSFPADYREFIDTYGPGKFGDIRVTAPTAPGVSGELDLLALMVRKYREIRGIPQIGASPPLYPEPGGTVCWGERSGGWLCGWEPASTDPDEWTVATILADTKLRGGDCARSCPSVLCSKSMHNQRMYNGLIPHRDPAAGPVVFIPYAT